MTAPTLELDHWFAEPGGVFDGRVRLPPSPELTGRRVRGLRVELHYHTTGRGDRNQWIGPPQTFALGPDGSLQQQFVLPVPPDAPISYDGTLMRLIWSVRAVVDISMDTDPRSEVPVVVVPYGGLALYTQHRRPHPLSSRPVEPPRL
jgi:hypothetical protein